MDIIHFKTKNNILKSITNFIFIPSIAYLGTYILQKAIAAAKAAVSRFVDLLVMA